jgi:hypothetical protein
VTIHEKIMRMASLILLWVAVILFVTGFAVQIAARLGSTDLYSGESGLSVFEFLTALHTGLSSAVLPLIGSAVVWFMQNGKGGPK